MTFRTKFQVLALAGCLLSFAPKTFADPVTGCANNAGSPLLINGALHTFFTCNIYNPGTTQTVSLLPYLTQGGADLLTNAVGAGYAIVINGDPLAISNNNTNPSALYNQSLWDAVLYFPGDLAGGTESDMFTVYWPGSFPASSTIQAFDNALYAQFNIPETRYFTQAINGVASIGAGGVATYNVFLTNPTTSAVPEPNPLVLVCSGLLLAGMAVGVNRLRQAASPASAL
jgi:hypothetical protein